MKNKLKNISQLIKIKAMMKNILFTLILMVSISLGSAQFCNNSAIDCNLNGFCIDNHCRCFNNYVTYQSETSCNYHQKDRTTAFLLELFLGEFGAGWFYLGRIEFAVPVLILTLVLGCCLKPMIVICYDEHQETNRTLLFRICSVCCAIMASCTIFGLWLHGMIVTGNGTATDSNGVSVGIW